MPRKVDSSAYGWSPVDSLFLTNPQNGVGYHLISAAARLNVKSKVQNEVMAQELKPLQCLFGNPDQSKVDVANSCSAVVISPLQWLQNQVVSEDELSEAIEFITKLDSAVHPVMTMPIKLSEEQKSRAFKANPNLTLVLCPQIFGFKDLGVIDSVVSALREDNGRLWSGIKKTDSTYHAAFVDDLCGHLISVLGQSKHMGKTLVVEPTELKLSEFLDQLEKILEFKPSFMEKLFSTKHGPLKPEFFEEKQMLDLFKDNETFRILDLVPSAVTKPSTWTEKFCDRLEKEPNSDLHFPPSKSV